MKNDQTVTESAAPKREAVADCAGRTCSESVTVADILPFWRYAVGPTSGHSPAIPFYRLAEALDFFAEAKRDMPWAGVILYRRRWWRGIETFKEYIPNVEVKHER